MIASTVISKNRTSIQNEFWEIIARFLIFSGFLVALCSLAGAYQPLIICLPIGLIVIALDLFLNQRKGFITPFPLLMVALAALIAFIGWRWVSEGLYQFLNGFLVVYGRQTGHAVQAFIIREGGNVQACLRAFFLVISLVAACVAARRWCWFLYIPLAAFALIWGIFPPVIPGVFVLVGALISLLRFAGKGFKNTGASIPVLFLLFALLAGVFYPVLNRYERPITVQNADSVLSAAVSAARYRETDENTLGGSSFSNVDGLALTDTLMLKVAMSQPDSLYLRGFVGSTYTGQGWTELDPEVYYEGNGLFYWLNEAGFSGLHQLADVAALTGEETAENSISVENVGASSRYFYTPYELISLTDSLRLSKGDSYLKADGVFGTRTYSFTASLNLVSRYVSLASSYYDQLLDDSDYGQNEGFYNEFVYRAYTEVPEEIRSLVMGQIGTVDYYESHMPYEEAIPLVENYLKDGMTYSEEVSAVSNGADFLTSFLQNRTGYSVHYATAATVMLRSLGIPARYVEGYLITPEMADAADEQNEIPVTGKSAHAWTEFYLDGVGWVPMEVTPAYAGAMDLAGDWSGGTGGDDEKGSEEQNVIDPATYQGETDAANEERKIGEVTIFILLILVALLLIAGIGYLIRKRLLLRKRLNAFRSPDNRSAILAMFPYITDLLRYGGMADVPALRPAYTKACEEAYSEAFANKFGEIITIWQHGAYSPHPVPKADRAQMQTFLAQTLELMRLSIGFRRRLWGKWIKALY